MLSAPEVYSVISNFPISTGQLKKLQVETINSKRLKTLANYVAQGWVELQKQLNSELKPWYSLRDDLTVVNNLILKGSKIVIQNT